MKKTAFTVLGSAIVLAAAAQPYPREERFTLDNRKQMTDASVSLFNVHSEYDFPYRVPTREDIGEKLVRILRFLEKSTAKEIVDAQTGKPVTDMTRIPQRFAFEHTDFRPYTYEWGVTYSGMLRAAEVTGEAGFRRYVTERMRLLSDVLPTVARRLEADPGYNSPLSRVAAPHNLDQCGSLTAAMIRTARLGESGIALTPFIENSVRFITSRQHRLDDGTLARKEPYESTLWLDDLYMSVPALAEMYKTSGDEKYLDDAVRQILGFSERMFVPETGLYMHSWVDKMEYHPRLYWGRANGWATLSLCDLLDVMPTDHPQREKVLGLFRAHCIGLLARQSGGGMWYQLLDRPDSYPESSGTAIFVYGLAHGIDRGWLDAKAFGPAALLGWNALSEQINNMGQIENVCVGTGVSYEPAYYYNRLVHPYTAHGYGPVLLAGSEMIRLLDTFPTSQQTAIYFFDKK